MGGASRKMVELPEEPQGLVDSLHKAFTEAKFPGFVFFYHSANGYEHELAGVVTGMDIGGGRLKVFVSAQMLGDGSQLLWFSFTAQEGEGKKKEWAAEVYDKFLGHKPAVWGALKLLRKPTPKSPERKCKA